MDDLTEFERSFEDRVRAFARAGVLPVDAAAVARAAAVAGAHPAPAGWLLRWRGTPIDRRGWTTAVVLALLAVALGSALLVGARLLLPPPSTVPPATNGWIAFTVWQPGSEGVDGDEDPDIWLAALDQEARRVVGDETDRVQQLCPAFAPDGRSLAYGRVEGQGTRYAVSEDGSESTEPASYRRAALVIADVSDDGRVSDRLSVDVGGGLPPPCPIWSADGARIAFAVNRTPPANPETTAAGSEVRVVTLADRGVTVLPDLLATDLDWSPDGRFLAIVSGTDDRVPGEILRDGRVHLYEPASGAVRSLDETLGAAHVTWAPDGRRLAYVTGDARHELRVLDVDSGIEQVLAAGFEAIHGSGPVWSPDGSTIAYQRICATSPNRPGAPCREQHEVVLLALGGPSASGADIGETVVPFQRAEPGADSFLFPYRVTWSPDGTYLLYVAWEEGAEGSGPALVAVPVSLEGPPVLVARIEGTSAYDGYPDTTVVPIQTWGRAPTD